MSGSREAFEAWALMNVGQPDFGGYHTDGGRWFYRHNFIRMCWEAWQAALAAQQKAFPTPAELAAMDDGKPVLGTPLEQQKAEPVAWMHDEPGRVDVIHNSVKELWREVMTAGNFLRKPSPVEHYTIPLYAAPPLDPEGIRLLREARRGHYYCEDSWYSCPKAEDGCADESQGTECNCGADEWNAKIDAYFAKYHSGPVVGAPSAQRDNAE